MALYHKWDVKDDFAYVLTLFSLISDSLGSVLSEINLFQFILSQIFIIERFFTIWGLKQSNPNLIIWKRRSSFFAGQERTMELNSL